MRKGGEKRATETSPGAETSDSAGGGLVAFGVHKMSKRDADRIEEHTGIPPEAFAAKKKQILGP